VTEYRWRREFGGLKRDQVRHLIPRLSGHDRWAQSRRPMEVMCQG
jgi:hypothetical protein